MNWLDRRVAVTGSAGVIGRRLLNLLSSQGAVIWSLDLNPLPVEVNAKGIKHYEMDLGLMPPEKLVDFDPEVIFHLAASFERSTETADFWEENYRNNLVASHSLIEAANKCRKLEVLVFASSYLVYTPELYLGNREGYTCKLKETDPVGPRNLCGSTKYYTEGELEFISRIGGFRSIFARIYRVFGRGSRDVISRWVRAALADESIEVYGEQNHFDYIFADDVAKGLCRLAIADDCIGPVNLSFGRARGIADVVTALTKLIPNLKVDRIDTKTPLEGSEADISKLIQLTGWRPDISVEEGIRMVVEYETKRRSLAVASRAYFINTCAG